MVFEAEYNYGETICREILTENEKEQLIGASTKMENDIEDAFDDIGIAGRKLKKALWTHSRYRK